MEGFHHFQHRCYHTLKIGLLWLIYAKIEMWAATHEYLIHQHWTAIVILQIPKYLVWNIIESFSICKISWQFGLLFSYRNKWVFETKFVFEMITSSNVVKEQGHNYFLNLKMQISISIKWEMVLLNIATVTSCRSAQKT